MLSGWGWRPACFRHLDWDLGLIKLSEKASAIELNAEECFFVASPVRCCISCRAQCFARSSSSSDNHCYLHTSGRMQEMFGSDFRRVHHFGAHSVWPDSKQLLIFFGVRSGPDGREIDAGDFALSLSFDAIDDQAAELCRRFSCHTFLQSWSEWLSLIANCWNRFFLLSILELGAR